MMERPDVDAVRNRILAALRNSPVGASTRFSLAEEVLDHYPFLERDDARSLVSRALAILQDSGDVAVLRPESWDMSGDERVRLART